MRGSKAKKIRDMIKLGNPLQRENRPYHLIEAPGIRQLVCAGSRRAYRVAKRLAAGGNPRPPLF